jgi:CRISPR/Cas system-associated exonuclease Cas4 (RecB family)
MRRMPDTPRLELIQAETPPELMQRVAESIVESPRADVFAPTIVIAASSLLAAHIGMQVTSRGRATRFAGMSWFDVAHRLAADVRDERRLLTPEAAAWLSSRFLAAARPPGYLDPVLDVRGFRAALLESFAALAAAGLGSAASAERFLVRHAPPLHPRVRHVLELYIGFRRTFEPTHDDAARIFEIAIAAAPERAAATLGSQRVWVVLTEASTLELRLLEALAGDPKLGVGIYTAVAFTRDPGVRDALARLGCRLPEAAGSATRAPARVHVLSTPSEESEAVEIGRRLLAAADRGVPFRDMAVLARNARALRAVAEALAKIGIPCWQTAGTPLLASRSGRAFLAFLDLLDHGLAIEPAMRFLSVAPMRWRDWCGISDDAAPSALERVAHQAFLGTGLADWRAKLELYGGQQEQAADARRQDDEPAQRARAAAQAAAELQHVAAALDRELVAFPARARWRELVRAARAFLERAFVPSPEREALAAALDRLRVLDAPGHTRATRAEFRDATQALFAASAIQAEPPVAGAVTLGTAAALAGASFPVVCLVGVRDGDWPPGLGGDPVLRERDRALLRGMLPEARALPDRQQQQEREARAFAAAAGAATDELVLSFARLDPATGAARLPATFLVLWAEGVTQQRLDYARLEALPFFERVPLVRRAMPSAQPVVSLDELDALAIAQLGPRAGRRYARRLGAAPARALAVDLMRNTRRRFTAYDGLVRGGDAPQTLHDHLTAQPLSASQLATFMACPFRFFMQRLLRLEPIDRDSHRELSALEVGRLVHTVLERFYARRQAAASAPAGGAFAAHRELLLDVAAEAFAALEASGQAGARLLWDIRKKRLREDLVRFLRLELQRLDEPPGWQPAAFEQRFGPDRELHLEVGLGDGLAMPLRGSIDRIDRARVGDALCVIDYKSGRKRRAKRLPQSVQLVVYLLAACGADRTLLERSEARFVYVTRRGGFEMQRLPGRVVVARRADFERLVRDVMASGEAGEFFPQPGPNAAECTVCDYNTVCEMRVAWQSGMKALAGQDRRYRALPDFGDTLEDAGTSAASGREATS